MTLGLSPLGTGRARGARVSCLLPRLARGGPVALPFGTALVPQPGGAGAGAGIPSPALGQGSCSQPARGSEHRRGLDKVVAQQLS